MNSQEWTGSFCIRMAKMFTLLCCASLAQSVSHGGPSRISVEPDGGYSGIVVKVSTSQKLFSRRRRRIS